jgi:transcriptional regulator with XRE-family HTH domain
MAKKFRDLAAAIDNDPVRRVKVDEEKRAMDTILALAELRNARGATQGEMARQLDVSQANISRIEHEENIFLSTLRDYIGALGGRLELRAVFPDGVVIDLVPRESSEPQPMLATAD